MRITIFAKDAFNFFPLSYGYRYLGVIPIKRNLDCVQANNFVVQAAALYDNEKTLWTAMAPEGTRRYQAELRSGYYYFAKQADTKIIVVGPDFANRKLMIMPPRDIKESFVEDAQDLIRFSRRGHPKRPQNCL